MLLSFAVVLEAALANLFNLLILVSQWVIPQTIVRIKLVALFDYFYFIIRVELLLVLVVQLRLRVLSSSSSSTTSTEY